MKMDELIDKNTVIESVNNYATEALNHFVY